MATQARSLWTQTYRLTIERPKPVAEQAPVVAGTFPVKPAQPANKSAAAVVVPATAPATAPAAAPAAASGPKAPTKRLASRWLERYK